MKGYHFLGVKKMPWEDNILDGILEQDDINLTKFLEPDFIALLNRFQTSINQSRRRKVRVQPFFYRGNTFPLEHISREVVTKGKIFGDVVKLFLRRKIERSDLKGGVRLIEGFFFVKKLGRNQYIAFTLGDRDFATYGLKHYLDSLQPNLTKPILTSEEIIEILQSFTDVVNEAYNVTPKTTIFYNRDEKADISYTSKSIEDVSFKYKNENLYINKIRFEIINGTEKQKVFSGSIERSGSLEFKEGNITIILELIKKLFKPAERKSSVFSSSDRNDFKRLAKRCIKLEYDYPILKKIKDNERLFKTLDNIPKSEFVVFHYNPYLHASFFDYSDGSTFDIFGLSDKMISIIPSENATESSFTNMLDRIQKDFGEGNINEFVVPDFSLQDIKA